MAPKEKREEVVAFLRLIKDVQRERCEHKGHQVQDEDVRPAKIPWGKEQSSLISVLEHYTAGPKTEAS